jgi:hypothetical protein
MVTRALTHPAAAGGKKAAIARVLDVHTRAAQDRLRLTLGTKADIIRQGNGGEIRIAFKDENELIRIFEILVRDEGRGSRR